jgi:hypothetical protein
VRSAVFVFIAFSIPVAVDARTCGCERTASPCAAYSTAAAVFVGRVDSITRSAGGRTIAFTVLEAFRGVTSSTVDVVTGPAGGRCSLSFREGREYVVYASRAGHSDPLITNACTRTREMDDAGADLAHARTSKAGTAPAGRIAGQVLLGRRDLAGAPLNAPRPLPGISVRIVKGDTTETAVTNIAGDFSFQNRGAATYSIQVDVPREYYSDEPSTSVKLQHPSACADVELLLYHNGRVTGRVLDGSGRPVGGLTIELAATSLSQSQRAMTDRDGAYRFTRVPAGRFFLGLNLTAPRQSGFEEPRIFLPGVEKATAAQHVTVGAGEQLTVGDFVIPSHFKYVALSGFVLNADGTPAEGARVYLKGTAEGARIVSEPATVDFLGRFAIAGVAGNEYCMFAERGFERRTESSDVIHLTAAEGLRPLRLVLYRRY